MYMYKVAQKVNHYQVIKNRIESYQSLSMRLNLLELFAKLKYELSTIILFVVDITMPDPQTGDMHQIR